MVFSPFDKNLDSRLCIHIKLLMYTDCVRELMCYKSFNLIQEGNGNSYPEDFIEYFQEEIDSLSSLVNESPNIILRKDGVLTELIE